MAKLLQVRNLPDEVHETLTRRAKDAGMSLSEYVGRELTALTKRGTMRDYFARLDALGIHIEGEPLDVVAVIREERENHEQQLYSRLVDRR